MRTLLLFSLLLPLVACRNQAVVEDPSIVQSPYGPIDVTSYRTTIERGISFENYLVHASPQEQLGCAYAMISERFPKYDLSKLELWSIRNNSQKKAIDDLGTVYDVSLIIDLRDTSSMEKQKETEHMIIYHYPSFRVEFHLDWDKAGADRRFYVNKSYGIHKEKIEKASSPAPSK
ncbi:MAG: hypothetical protein AAF558_06410 [Verrucomicrobiota bacterium]